MDSDQIHIALIGLGVSRSAAVRMHNFYERLTKSKKKRTTAVRNEVSIWDGAQRWT